MAITKTSDAVRWMQRQYGRGCLAPMTGQDSRAWAAFLLLLDLYSAADNPGRYRALRAMTETILAAQRSVAALFTQVVPFVIDGRDGVTLQRELALALDVADEYADDPNVDL